MMQLNTILKRIKAGRKVRFVHDFLGGQFVEISGVFLGWPRKRIKLSPEEVVSVKQALTERRQGMAGRRQA